MSRNRESLSGSRRSLSGNMESLSGSRRSLSGNREILSGNRRSLSGYKESFTGNERYSRKDGKVTDFFDVTLDTNNTSTLINFIVEIDKYISAC